MGDIIDNVFEGSVDDEEGPVYYELSNSCMRIADLCVNIAQEFAFLSQGIENYIRYLDKSLKSLEDKDGNESW